MSVSWLWAIINWLSLPVLALLAGILLWRKRRIEFPLFSWFVGVTVLTGVVRLVFQSRDPRVYFYVYWMSDLVFQIVIMLAVYELFVLRLFPGFYRIRFYRLLSAAIISLIILGSGLAAFESHNTGAAIAKLSRVLDFVIVVVLVMFVCLMVLMGRIWTRLDFGIALGFALNSAASLISSAMWIRTHYQHTLMDALPTVGFDISCLLWLFCFWTAGASQEKPATQPLDPMMLQQARDWEATLKDRVLPRKTSGRGL